MTEDEVRAVVRDACEDAGSITAWATEAGMSVQYVSDFLHGRRKPGSKILKALGLVKREEYVEEEERA